MWGLRTEDSDNDKDIYREEREDPRRYAKKTKTLVVNDGTA